MAAPAIEPALPSAVAGTAAPQSPRVSLNWATGHLPNCTQARRRRRYLRTHDWIIGRAATAHSVAPLSPTNTRGPCPRRFALGAPSRSAACVPSPVLQEAMPIPAARNVAPPSRKLCAQGVRGNAAARTRHLGWGLIDGYGGCRMTGVNGRVG
jgi:hypothetical protein